MAAACRRLLPSAVLLAGFLACGRSPTQGQPHLTTLTVGFGLAAGKDPQTGIRQVARSLQFEDLTTVSPDGRSVARLAKNWSWSPDRLRLHVQLRPSATFHSGRAVDGLAVRHALADQLPSKLGPAFNDILRIETEPDSVEFWLRRPISFLPGALADTAIWDPSRPSSGTGPFYTVGAEGADVEMRANDHYYNGRPAIDRVVIRPFATVRGAWAEMLRRRVDVLYEVGPDALDFLESSNQVRVFRYEQGGYAYLVLLNVANDLFRDPKFRRQLNAAIDRTALVRDVWGGHAEAADSPVRHTHWAFSQAAPRFRYDPSGARSEGRREFTCLAVDPSHERLALLVQQQLRQVGVDVKFEFVPTDEAVERLRHGDFEAILLDYALGPDLVWQYLSWYSSGPNNLWHYSNPAVDIALDKIRYAVDDNSYRAGVDAFQRAIVNDPPAIFLTWRERIRAVSRRFVVPPVPPGTDVFTTIRFWTPAAAEPLSAN